MSHPAQVYELTLDYVLFAWLWIKRNSASYRGQIFVHYLIGFSVIRSIVELFRSNPEILGFLSVSHLLSAAGIIAGLILHQYLKKRYPLEATRQETASPVTTILVAILLIIFSAGLYYFIQG